MTNALISLGKYLTHLLIENQWGNGLAHNSRAVLTPRGVVARSVSMPPVPTPFTILATHEASR